MLASEFVSGLVNNIGVPGEILILIPLYFVAMILVNLKICVAMVGSELGGIAVTVFCSVCRMQLSWLQVLMSQAFVRDCGSSLSTLN